MDHQVSPSLLAANFGRLEDEITAVNRSSADWLHLDIMDGVFVPNISFGFPVIKYIKELSEKPLDVHLMIVKPDRYIERFRDAGASNLTIHYEACRHINRAVTQIRELGMTAGVSLNPSTPVSMLVDILPFIDMVLIMAVNPGYGGQKFITNSYGRIKELKGMIAAGGYDVKIQVDGGIDFSNARKLVDTGVDILVTGSTVFRAADHGEAIRKLKTLEGI